METSGINSTSTPNNNIINNSSSKSQDHQGSEGKNHDNVQNLPAISQQCQSNHCEKTDCEIVQNCVNFKEQSLLDRVKTLPAIFQSQQKDDPDLTVQEKRKIAEDLLKKNPLSFLTKFGEYLEEEHLNYFLDKYSSYEVEHYVKKFKNLLNDRSKKILKKNRRYEAMKKLETEGSYFSEAEMEKREPLLYHQMVGQYLSEKEKLIKSRQAHGNVIPTFSNFLIHKMDREELESIVKAQQEEENKMKSTDSSSEEEVGDDENKEKRWGEDWEDEILKKKVKEKRPLKEKVHISSKEKVLLLNEFKSIMKSNFLNGKDSGFDYSEVDLNPDYDSIEIRTQDEEEKYFDEESNDNTVCTDTGIEDY